MIDINWVPGITLEQIEKATILKAFKFYRQNKTQTANVLGICIRTLDSKLEKYADDERSELERFDRDKRERNNTLNRLRGLNTQEASGQGNRYDPAPGFPVESIADYPSQQPVSVPQREEVQEVLPKKSSQNSKK